MTDENRCLYVKRKIRSCRPLSPRKKRERSACPECNSIFVKKRHRTYDYTCRSCGWEGVAVKKIMW